MLGIVPHRRAVSFPSQSPSRFNRARAATAAGRSDRPQRLARSWRQGRAGGAL